MTRTFYPISFLPDLRDYFILKGVILQISYRSSFSHRLFQKIVESSKSTNIILRRSEGGQKAVRRHQYIERVLGQNAHVVYRPECRWVGRHVSPDNDSIITFD